MYQVRLAKHNKIKERNPELELEAPVDYSSMDPPVLTGILYKFAKTDYKSEYDKVSAGFHLTRGSQQGLFNRQVHSSYTAPGPANTLWSNAGQMRTKWDAGQIIEKDTKYVTKDWEEYSFEEVMKWSWTSWVDAIGYAPPDWVKKDLFMYDGTTGIIWRVVFYSWTQGAAGGGFTYTRIAIAEDREKILSKKLGDGSKFVEG
jgi:hypothetical protein